MRRFSPSWRALAALALAVPLLAGCATPDAGERRLDVSTSYNAAETSPDDVENGPPAGSTAGGGYILVHVAPDRDWVRYRGFVDSGLADFTQPPEATRGDLLELADDGGAARYRLTLDAQGRTDFLVDDGVWVRLEMSGGAAPGATCDASYIGSSPVDARVERALELTLPFGIACLQSV